jgi:hypothetical protein
MLGGEDNAGCTRIRNVLDSYRMIFHGSVSQMCCGSTQRKSIIHEGDEIKVVLTRLIRADNLCCSTLMNGGFLCIYSVLSSIETIYLLSGTSCQDVDFFFFPDFHDVGLVLTSKIWYNIFENLTREWINFMELRLCVYTPSVHVWR